MIKFINILGQGVGRDSKRKIKLVFPMWAQVKFQAENILLSFPKCGRSWLRLMIFDLIRHHYRLDANTVLKDNELYKIDSELKPISFSHDDEPMFKRPEKIHKNKSAYSEKKVLFLVRNPIDTAISWYFQVVKRGSIKWFKEEAQFENPRDFIFNEVGGLRTIVEYYNVWAENQNEPKNFKIVSYEELRENPLNNLKMVMDFFGMSNVFDESDYKYAVEMNDFKKVKEREAKNELEGETFKTSTPEDSDSYKARKAKVKGYVDYLTEDEITYAEKYVSENLNKIYKY
jgi:hypothetical protein